MDEEMAALGVGGGGEKPAPSDTEPPPDVESEALDDFIAAVKSGDKAAAKSSFKAAVEACVTRVMADEY